MEEQDKETLERIQDVWKRWKNSQHSWRSSHAMIDLNKIMIDAEASGELRKRMPEDD